VGEIFDNDQRVLGAEALKRDTIVKVGTVAWADLELASPMTLNEKATPVSTTDVRGAMDEEKLERLSETLAELMLSTPAHHRILSPE